MSSQHDFESLDIGRVEECIEKEHVEYNNSGVGYYDDVEDFILNVIDPPDIDTDLSGFYDWYYSNDMRRDNRRKRGFKKSIAMSKIKLNPHQIRVARFIKNNRGLVAKHGTGSGKTLTAITCMQVIMGMKPNIDINIITPLSLKNNFKKEMRKFGMRIDKRIHFYTPQKFSNLFLAAIRKNDDEFINTIRDSFIILDEAHSYRSPVRFSKSGDIKSGIRSWTAIEACKIAFRVLALTATPVYNDPSDVINLIAMINGQNPMSYATFNKMFTDWDIEKMIPYLNCQFSVYETPLDENYPTHTVHNIEVPMSDEYYVEYSKVERRQSGYFTNPWTFLTGIRQATNAFTGCDKCQWIMDMVTPDTDGKPPKTVIYSSFKTYGINIIKSMLYERGIRFTQVTGDMNEGQRRQAVRDYNSNSRSSANILFITKAGAEGLDLKGTKIVIMLESGWNIPSELQIQGRAIRYGSHTHLPEDQRHVDVYKLRLVKTERQKLNDVREFNIKYNKVKDSADIILKKISERKHKLNMQFMDFIMEYSIENNMDGDRFECPDTRPSISNDRWIGINL